MNDSNRDCLKSFCDDMQSALSSIKDQCDIVEGQQDADILDEIEFQAGQIEAMLYKINSFVDKGREFGI